MNPDALRDQLSAWLNDGEAGHVLCAIRPARRVEAGDRQRIVQFLAEEFTLSVTSEYLVEIPREVALEIATRLVAGPVFGPLVRDEANARAVAQDFIDAFDQQARFYSTYAYVKPEGQSGFTMRGRALLPNSYDEGICVIDSGRVGILWVGDED